MRIPEIWQREMDAGTEFGERVRKALRNVNPSAGVSPVKPPPVVSDVGTRVRAAIETECGFSMTCGDCLKYIRSLDYSTEHNVNTIVPRLLTEIALPVECRKKIGSIEDQGYWLADIVGRAIIQSRKTVE